MPISVVCQKCGKALKVKDEWKGKRATCPGCGATFIVGGGGVPSPVAGATVFNPNAAVAAKAQREKAVGSFSVSPGLVIGTIAILLFCGTIGAFLMGPKKVWAEWEALGDTPKDTVIDVISRGEECYLQGLGMYNPRKVRGRPEAKEVLFFRPSFVMSMPDDVDFKGSSSLGQFKGVYHPKTGEIDATVDMGGGMGTPGSGGKKTTGMPLKISGHESAGKLTTFVNGKQVELVIPPPSADDDK